MSIRNLFIHKFLFMLSYASVVMNVGFIMIHHFLWTEPIFLLLFVLHNILLLRFLAHFETGCLWALIFVAFTMGLVKNTGFFIVLVSTLILLFSSPKPSIKYSIAYLLGGSIGFASWNLSVLFLRDGHGVYFDSNFLQGFNVNLTNYLDVISQWFLPGILPLYIRLTFIVILATGLFYLLIRKTPKKQAKIYFIQFLGYLMIMIFIIEVDLDEIERLLAIVAPWALIAIFMTIDINWKHFPKLVRKLFLLCCILWMTYIAIRSVRNANLWYEEACRTEFISNLSIEL